MKKWFMLAMIVCVAVAVQAGEEGKKKGKGGGDVTKEQFVERQKKMAENKGEDFDQAKVEARFDKMDKNGDGVLTADEKGQGQGQDQKKKKKSEEGDDE